MKSLTLPLLSVALATCLTAVTSAQDVRRGSTTTTTVTNTADHTQRSGGMDLAQGVYVASIDVEDRSLRKYAGQSLFNTQGAELGEVKDFIVHPATSRVRYAVVSSGGVLGGMGNSLRLVPIEVLRPGTRGNIFEVNILHSDWLQLPPVSDENYVTDRFNISAAQHGAMVHAFGSGDRGTTTTRSAENEFAGLIRASAIRGKAVRAGNIKVGDIENIIIDLEHGTASALLDSSGDFTGTSAKYLVPLSRLVINNSRQNPIATTLTRADFDRARPGSFGITADTVASTDTRATTDTRGTGDVRVAGDTRVTTEPALAPTGRPTAQPVTNSSADPLTTSVQAIRRAINNDPVLVGEQVQVMMDEGRIVLRGAVRDTATRNNLENAARRAVPNANIENQIAVIER